MASAVVVCVKRKRGVEPKSSLVVSCKRPRLCGNGDETTTAGCDVVEDDIKHVFKYGVTTTQLPLSSQQDDGSIPILAGIPNMDGVRLVVTDFEKLFPRSKRKKMEPAEQPPSGDATGVLSVFNKVTDDIVTDQQQPAVGSDSVTTVSSSISCNGVSMVSVKKAANSCVENADVMYDVYLAPNDGLFFTDWLTNIVDVRFANEIASKEVLDPTESDDSDGEADDDDSNSENNWRNDYPDEDSNEDENEQSGDANSDVDDEEGDVIRRMRDVRFSEDEHTDDSRE